MCSGAVEVLRSHSSAHMRKHAMLRLAFCWRYRSDCWTARGGGCGERMRPRRPAADKHVALSDAALGDRTLTVSQAAQAQLQCFLAPHVAEATRAWTGPHSAVQYGRVHGEGALFKEVLEKIEAKELIAKIGDKVDEDYIHDFRNWVVGIGKRSFTPTQIAENASAVIDAISKAKPASFKGIYVKSITLSSSMSPGIKVSTSAISQS
jgi:hypothetical protein